MTQSDCNAVTAIDSLDRDELVAATQLLRTSLTEAATSPDGDHGASTSAIDERAVISGVKAEYSTYDRVIVLQNEVNGYRVGGFDQDHATGATAVLPFVDVIIDTSDPKNPSLIIEQPDAVSAYEKAPAFALDNSISISPRSSNRHLPCRPSPSLRKL